MKRNKIQESRDKNQVNQMLELSGSPGYQGNDELQFC